MVGIVRRDYLDPDPALNACQKMRDWLTERYGMGYLDSYGQDMTRLCEEYFDLPDKLTALTVSGIFHMKWQLCYYNYLEEGKPKSATGNKSIYRVLVLVPDDTVGIEMLLTL
jgi:hypothetical protein